MESNNRLFFYGLIAAAIGVICLVWFFSTINTALYQWNAVTTVNFTVSNEDVAIDFKNVGGRQFQYILDEVEDNNFHITDDGDSEARATLCNVDLRVKTHMGNSKTEIRCRSTHSGSIVESFRSIENGKKFTALVGDIMEGILSAIHEVQKKSSDMS